MQTPTKFFRLLTGKIEKATKGSAAFDLFYNGTVPLIIGDKPVKIPTGVTTEFSPNLVAIIKEKSGLADRGVELKAGVIDSDYRKEWMVVARFPVQCDRFGRNQNDHFNGETCIHVKPGDKIAQVILVEIPEVHFSFHPDAQLIMKDDVREGGFGSTGK
jgi:dUTPase